MEGERILSTVTGSSQNEQKNKDNRSFYLWVEWRSKLMKHLKSSCLSIISPATKISLYCCKQKEILFYFNYVLYFSIIFQKCTAIFLNFKLCTAISFNFVSYTFISLHFLLCIAISLYFLLCMVISPYESNPPVFQWNTANSVYFPYLC